MTDTKKKASASIVRKELTELRKKWGWGASDIIRLLKGGGNSSKGSAFEREVCKQFSLWWTKDVRDDVFWRSSASGARATVRGRTGAKTAGQYGDIAATDPVGKPLIDVFTIELKRGYSESTCQDPLDKLDAAGTQEWEGFICQAQEGHLQAVSVAWMLIVRRTRRQALLWMPVSMWHRLRSVGAFGGGTPDFCVRMTFPLRLLGNIEKCAVIGMHLDDWLANVTPEHVIKINNTRAFIKYKSK